MHWRGSVAAMMHNQQASSARRCSLGTDKMHKLAVWAKHLSKAEPFFSEMCLETYSEYTLWCASGGLITCWGWSWDV